MLPLEPAVAEEHVDVWLTGIGRMSCGHWQSTRERRAEGSSWLFGFWSAMNYVAGVENLPQVKIESTAIVSEVAKACTQRPGSSLATAGWETFIAVQKGNDIAR